MDFKPGDIVKLRSGGPKMTVEKYHKRDVVKCIWFVGDEVKQGFFRQGFLTLATDEKEIKKAKEKKEDGAK